MAFLIGKYAGPARTFPTSVSILFISIRRLNEKILPQWRRSVIRERSVNMPTIDNAAQPLGTPREGLLAPLSGVDEYFPQVTQEASTGQNLTAVGNPKATRSVIYANAENSKKVTITVDQYESSTDASSAYQQAVEKSKIPGFKPVSVPNVGQEAFAGTVTMRAETHVGLGALVGKLIIGVTLAGYHATPDNIAKLVAVARKEEATARAALGASGNQ